MNAHFLGDLAVVPTGIERLGDTRAEAKGREWAIRPSSDTVPEPRGAERADSAISRVGKQNCQDAYAMASPVHGGLVRVRRSRGRRRCVKQLAARRWLVFPRGCKRALLFE